MKARKRIISFILSFLMVLSSITPALNVYAETPEPTYTKVDVVNPVANSWCTKTTAGDGGPGYAFDGDNGNWWHTNYTAEDRTDTNKLAGDFTNAEVSDIPAFADISSSRVWIGGEFGKEVNLGKFVYKPRTNANKNWIGQWVLYTANVTGTPTDADFSTVAATGTFNSSNEVETVLTTPVKATHFRLVAFSYHSGQATASKIEMYSVPETTPEMPPTGGEEGGEDPVVPPTGGEEGGNETPTPSVVEETTILHSETTRQDGNYFTYSGTGWTAMGNSTEHVWSDTPSTAEQALSIWYEVDFVGHKIDIYAGKNRPHGNVKYYIDGNEVGTFSLYNNGNINSTYITTIDNLTEGKHTFKAVAVEANKCIDCAQVVVYHAPYEVTDVAIAETAVSLSEGSSKAISYTVAPDYAYLKGASYTSANPDIATVDANGVITAVAVGTTTVSLTASNMSATKEITVDVVAAVPGIAGTIVDTDTQWTQNRYNEVKGLGALTSTVTAWKNDKAVSEIALVSVDSALKNVTVSASDLVSGDKTIAASNVTATFIKSTKAYNGGYLGYGDPNRALPEDNGTNRSESSDILYQTTPIDIPFNSVQPVWVEFEIPKNAEAGTYTGTITVTAEGIEEPLTFTYTVNVQNATLPDAGDFKDGFDIELWQYPYTSAEYYNVIPFSEEHFAIMESGMEIYKEIGGHAITTSIVEEAWSGQTYSENAVHYPSMVKWNKQADGSFDWDYTDFDKWVTFCKSMGLGDKIVLYSIAPWNNSIGYWENGTLKYQGFSLSNASDQDIWKAFLRDLIDHLMDKGWFDDAYMGIDERGFSKAAFDLIESVVNVYTVPLKTAGAMDHFVDKWDLALRVTDLNVGDTAAAANPAKFKELLAAREAKGYRTTLYSCTEHQPGNFSLSAPVESYWSIVNAGMMETAGFLRWAYDAWVADPLRDATHNAFEPGDCFLIYPDEKDATNPTSKSSVRLERMAEGVRDVNKLMQIKEEVPALSSKVDAVFDKIQYQPATSRSYLNANGIAQLRNETVVFKQALNALTEEYITLKATGTNEVTSVAIAQGTTAELALGNTLQLTAELTPANLLNDNVIWTSSNDKIATVDANGQVVTVAEGTVTITATAEVDETKKAQIVITVKGIEIDAAKQVSYYSFDNITDTTVNDEWGNRDGQLLGSTAKGKQGNALSVTEELQSMTVGGNNTLSGDWTVGYWVKTTSTFDKEISALEDATKSYSFSLKMASDRDSGFRVGNNGGDVLTFSYPFKKDTWYHMTWTKDEDAGLSLYVNGQFVVKNTWTNNRAIKAPYDIIGGTGFTGLIDEVKVYNTVLTPAEIVASMQVEGINIAANAVEMYIDDTYSLNASVVTENADKTITYSSSDENVATVSADGVITALKKGVAVITLSAAGYTETVQVTVIKELIISNELPVYMLDDKYLSDIDKPTDPSRQYLGQPDMIRTSTGRLITAYPQGHGHGPLVMQISDDNGETWTKKTDIPASWANSQETPTLYVLNMSDGTERLMLISSCPGWGQAYSDELYGFNTSYSDDNGDTWTEYKHWYPKLEGDVINAAVVGMASLVQLKDENGNYIDEWMGVYHFQAPFQNYKTILSFDENGEEQWSMPERLLEEHSNIESRYQMCEIGMFRSPDGKRIVGLARTQSHNNYSTLIYSDDEGKTWSEPMNLPGSLAGERHKAVYDPISGRLVITFREIRYDLNGNNKFDGASDWTCDDWGVWVGTYEDLMNQEPGDYRIRIEEDWAQSAKSGDTGYAGLVVLEDGTLIMDSYGHWDKEYSQSWGGGVTSDLCYIKQAKFKLADVENANGLVDYSDLEKEVAKAADFVGADYTDDSWNVFEDALTAAQAMVTDKNVQQVEVDVAIQALTDAVAALELKGADYTAVDVAKAKVPTDLSKYTEETVNALNAALAAVIEGLDITKQSEVDAMADGIEKAVAALKEKEVQPPSSGGSGTSGGSSSGGSSSGGSSSSGSIQTPSTSQKPAETKPQQTPSAAQKPVTQKPAETKPQQTTPETSTETQQVPVEEVKVDTKIVEETASEEVKTTVKETVTVTEEKATITTETVDKVIENTEKGATVILPLTEAAEEGQKVKEAEVPVEALGKIAEAESALTVEFEGAKVTFEPEAIKAITEQAKGSTIEIRVVPVENYELNEEQQAVLERHDVAVRVSAQILSDGEYIGNFNGGKARIAIPFNPGHGKKAEDHKVYYVADNGDMTLVPSAYADKHMIIETDHFSEYVIVYEGDVEVEEPVIIEDVTQDVTEEISTEEVPTQEVQEEKAGTPVLPIIIVIVVVLAIAAVTVMTMNKKNGEK